MATRLPSSSLKRRFAWTIGAITAVGIVSIVSMAIYRSGQLAAPGPAVAAADDHADKIEKSTAAITEPRDQPAGPKSAGDFHSSRYGYSVSLAGTPWSQWEDLSQVVPEAEWGALLDGFGRLLVVPVVLGDLNPRTEALDHALLARLGIAYPSEQLNDFSNIERQGATGQAFKLTRDVAGAENVYQLQVLKRGEIAYLVAAWIDHAAKAATIDDTVLDGVLGRFAFDADPPPVPDVHALKGMQRLAHGSIYNDLGLSAFNSRDFSGAIDCFRRALELQPDDPAILTNLMNAHIELKEYRQALEELEPQLNRFQNQPEVWAGRAFLLSELGETDAALSAYASLFSSGYFAEAPFTQYVTLLAENDRSDEALAAVERFLQAKDSYAVRRLQASLYRQRGDNEQALAILTRLAQNRPFNAELAYDLADCNLATNRFQESLDVCRQLLDHRYATGHTYLLQARAQYALKWYPQAKASLEAALEREPANKDAQDLLKVVTGLLKESGGAAQEPIEPVMLPKESADELESQPGAVADQGMHEFGAFYFRRQIGIRFEPSKQFKLTDRRTIRISDASGVQRFSTIQVPFDPLAERIFVNRLRITDANGDEIAVGKPDDYYITDGDRSEPALQRKWLNIAVPGLKPGNTIELVVTRQDIAAPAEFPYTAQLLSTDVPILAVELFVAADAGAIKFQASPGVDEKRLGEGIVWSIHNPPVYRREPLQPARSTFLPAVVIASSKATWEQLGKEYLASIAERLKPDPAVKSQAHDVTKDSSDDEARTIALVRYVQSQLTYKAIEFGPHARVPTAASDVLNAKYGDCKDHTLLLVQLLAACGIKSNLALANLDAPLHPELPSLEQFNHMLVYVPGFRKGKFFDCTEKDADLVSIPAPVDLGGDRVFVLDEDSPRLIELPAYGDKSSRLSVERTVRVVKETDAAVDETVTVTGYHAAFLRGMFKGVPLADRAATLQKELAPLGGAMQVQSLSIEHLEDRDQPLLFKAAYLVRGRFQRVEGTLVGQIPALWEQMYLDVPPVRDRRTPFEIEYPLSFSSSVQFIAPKGFAIQRPAGGEKQNQSPFAAWNTSTIAGRDKIKTKYELQLHAGRYSEDKYAAYSDDLRAAVEVLSPAVVLKKAK